MCCSIILLLYHEQQGVDYQMYLYSVYTCMYYTMYIHVHVYIVHRNYKYTPVLYIHVLYCRVYWYMYIVLYMHMSLGGPRVTFILVIEH